MGTAFQIVICVLSVVFFVSGFFETRKLLKGPIPPDWATFGPKREMRWRIAIAGVYAALFLFVGTYIVFNPGPKATTLNRIELCVFYVSVFVQSGVPSLFRAVQLFRRIRSVNASISHVRK